MTGPLHRPYPPDRYRGTTGEESGWIRPDDAEPEITYRSGGTCEYLATGDQTDGTFGLYRWTFGPDESGPDPHFHRARDPLPLGRLSRGPRDPRPHRADLRALPPHLR